MLGIVSVLALATTAPCCQVGESCAANEVEVSRLPVENSLAGFFGHLTDTSSYPARWNCGEWTQIEGWLHIISDVGIFLAYLAIPLAIAYCVLRRQDMRTNSVLWLFAAFILSCGTGHLLEAVIFYHPVYRIAGLLKLLTAVVSWATAIVLMRIMPRLLELPSLVSRNELLEKVAQTKGEFFANMSHELRTPMTAILGYAELLSDDEGSHAGSTTHQDAVRTIQQNGRHLLTIIDDVLDMSKIEAGRMKIECLKTDTARLIEEVTGLLRSRADGKGISLSVEYDETAPASFETDPTRVRQILLNLIGNAIKFTEVGGVSVNVSRVIGERDKHYMRFVVQDTGIGMTPEQLTVVRQFEPFTQADSSTTRCFGGTGLGLKICSSLAGLLGGSITIKSQADVGSTFTVLIEAGKTSIQPIKNKDASADLKSHAAQEPEQPSDNTTPLTGAKVLLVEDGPDNQRLIAFLLKKAGAEVELAENGRIGIERVLEAVQEGREHDLILMDMQMPVLDGYMATQELRQAGNDVPVVALTAHAMAEDRQRCLDAGCDDYLPKPINHQALLAICQQHLKGFQIRQACSIEA